MAKDIKVFTGAAWESIVGPPGKDGVDGKDGSGVTIKGTATTYPPDASPTVGDMWLTGDPVPAGAPAGTEVGDGLVWTGTAWNNVGGIRGPAGKDGADGADGAPGKDGVDGVGFTWKPNYIFGDVLDNNDVIPLLGSTYVASGMPAARAVDLSFVTRATPNPIPLPGGGELSLMAKAGESGTAGADGAKGDKGADGAPGADGVGFTFKGEWDGSTYAVNDVVTYQGTTYIMIAGFGDEDISDAAAWSPLVSSGADGAKGADGAAGADGRSVAVTVSATQPATAAVGDFWIEPT